MARAIDPGAPDGAPPLRRRRRLGWWLAAAGAAILGVAGFLVWRASHERPRYVTATVTLGDVQKSVGATGALNPLVTVQVGSYVSGTVKTLKCDFNTEVVVGQVCATIDPLPFQLVVDEDRAQVTTVEAQLRKDRAAQLYAKTAFERDSKLLAEGTVSQDAVDNDRSVYDQATAQIGLDQANAADKRSALKAAEVNLAYTDIRSPVVGTVITRTIDVGQTVAASLQAPTLFLIGKDLSKMQVDTNVSEADVGAVRLGQDASFTVQAFPGRTFRGRVRQIRRGPITVQNIVTYDVVVAFDNPQRLLFPGMTADTHVVIAEHDRVLRVPLPAVRFSPEGLARGGGGRRGGAGVAESAEAGGRDGGEERAAAAGQEVSAAAVPAEGSAEREEKALGETASEAGGEGRGEGRRRRHGEGGGEGGGGRWGGRRDRGDAGDGSGPAAAGERGGEAAGRQRGGGRASRTGGGRAAHRARVWVLGKDGALRPVDVTTGLDDGALIEVSGPGLRAGDRVVVNELRPDEHRRAAPTPGQNPGQNQVLRQGGRLL